MMNINICRTMLVEEQPGWRNRERLKRSFLGVVKKDVPFISEDKKCRRQGEMETCSVAYEEMPKSFPLASACGSEIHSGYTFHLIPVLRKNKDT